MRPQFFLGLAFVLALLWPQALGALHPQDTQALLSLSASLSGLDWDLVSPCTQQGITCDESSPQRVVALNVAALDLVGTIATYIGRLQALTYLNLGGNFIYNHLPTQIGSLKELRTLDLHDNFFEGALPTELGKLTQLTILHLGESGFQGFIPTQLGLLSNLVTLELKNNQFVGAIPTELFGLTHLETLSLLGSNNLCPVADYSGLASSSTDYDADRAEDCEGCETIFDTCQNEGVCNPQPDGSFTCDCQLGFAGLLCDSSVPTCPQLAADNAVWAPVNAQTAAVVGTCNEGFLGAPTRDCQAGGTWSSSASGEACTPAPTTDPTDQEALLAFWGGLVTPGQLAWDTSASLCDQQGITCDGAHKVTSLVLSGVSLAGPIHPKLGDLTALQHLDLSSNTLTGTIPAALGNLASLVTLHLNDNHLIGTIPGELNLPLLESLLVLGTNNLCPIANLSTWDLVTSDYDERPDPCLACATAYDTCANGGACSGNDGELFTCECLPGFGGSYCQDPAPYCEPTEAFGAAWPAAHPSATVDGACLPGYTGAPSLTCQADATWAESPGGTPCTRNRCQEEASHEFASWPESDSLTTAAGTCAPGYSGSPTRDCLADGWASEVINPCTRKTCPYEVSFTQHIIWEQTDSLTTASGTCFNGFEGAPSRDCLADGWDPTVDGTPCTLMRCPLDQVTNNATWLSYPSFTYGVPGSCNSGYCGAPVRDCVNGAWSSVRGTPCQASKLCTCGPGHYGSVTACTPCPQNTYQDETGQGTCKNCPPNSGSSPGSTKRANCTCLPGYQPFGGSCRLITCPAESHQTVTFPVTPGGVTASGTCKTGWVGTPSRQCGVDGQWSFTIQSPCLPVFIPTCRNPLQCGLLSQLNCNKCYHSGGMVDPRFPTLCYCPATIQYAHPASMTCSTPLTLCEGSYLCNTTCLTCNGPAAHQCLTCTDSENSELVYVGSNNFGYCLPNCPAGTYRHLSEYTCVPLTCAHLYGCSLHGTCVWTGYQSNCTCDANWGGLDCSIPLSCPQLNNCNNKGNCTLDRTTNSVYCKCLLGSEGPTCAIKQNFTTTNNIMTELGVNFLNITWSSRGFHHGDRVILHWWNKFTKNCTIHPPNAICLAPPHSSMLTAFDIYATINETYYTKVGRALITGSFSLPETYQAWEFMEWKSGVPRLFNYTLLPPYKKGGSTVTVEVYRFQYPADRDYGDFMIWPQMKYAGVVYTGPNNGTFTLTLDPNEYRFNYDNATHIMVISSSGLGAHGFYFVPEEPGFNKSQQCEIFRGWRYYMTQAIWQCVTPGTDPIKYIECTSLTRFPEITSVWNPCDEGQIYAETCYMWFDFFGRKTYHHLWEPNLFDSFDQEVIMYMASTILPKYMCCPVSNGLDCDKYLTKRKAWEREYPVRKRGVLPITAGSTGLAFGTLHFVSLDGVPFTFNALGEFILMQDNLGEFVVQIRTTKLPNKAASKISAVVVKGNGSKIGVYLDQLNQFALTFDDEFQTEDLPISSRDTLLISGDLVIRKLSEKALRITARNKVKITIKKDGGALHVQVVVPNNLREVLAPVITGLLGSFDGVPANDLVERHNSSAIVPPSSPTFVYEPFANSWRITPEESLFAYPIGMGHADYNDLSFVPQYPETLPFDPVYSDPATQVCSAAGDFANVCYFDLVLAQSYLPSNTIMEFSRYYNKIRSGNNYSPEFSGMSGNPVSLRLGEEYKVSFTVTDIDDSVFSVFVSSSPSPDGVFDPINYRYSFTMTDSVFLTRNLKPLTFTAVDELDGVESFLIPFYKRYSTCADGLDKVKIEAQLELDAFCHVTADTCTRDCRITLDRLFGLTCFPEIARDFGAALTVTQELCCDDYSIPCPEVNTLSQEAVVGVAVGVVLFVVLMVSLVGFLVFKKINSHPQDDPASHEMMALDDKLAL